MSAFHLAEINVARLLAPLDDPQIADFVADLGPINALADRSEGFVWRLQGAGGDATDLSYCSDPFVIVNMSVWTTPVALQHFIYRSGHIEVFRKRAKWLSPIQSHLTAYGGFLKAIRLPLTRGENGWLTTIGTVPHQRPSGFNTCTLLRCSSRIEIRSGPHYFRMLA